MQAPLVFITGASSGIGQALALRYHQAGYRLALVARREDVMHQWLEANGLDHRSAQVFAADVAQNASILQAAKDCMTQMGVPDVVIANAGISLGVDTAFEEDLAQLQAVYATNVMGLAATFSAFLQPMRQRGTGTLVGVASVAGIRGLPGHGAYCSSKAAVISFCESLRGEMRGTGIRVVTLCPGYVATPLTQKNRYPMPFLMAATAFANKAFQAIERQRSYVVIPWQMAWVAKLLRLLPNWVFDRALAGQPRKHRHTE